MKVLVMTASKYGSTREIGAAIADELVNAGFDVVQAEPSDAVQVGDFDAVVLGSAVYMTQWMENLRNFMAHHSAQLRAVPLWAFSVGLAGIPMGAVQDPRRIGPHLLSMSPLDHKTFKGRMDLSQLSLRERSIARLGNAPEGDYREWEKIRAWARQIAAHLTEHAPAT